jgi:hypothetical protein
MMGLAYVIFKLYRTIFTFFRLLYLSSSNVTYVFNIYLIFYIHSITSKNKYQ